MNAPIEEKLDLVIVGAGPAGLSAALEAQRGGLGKLVVLEKGPSHSTMIRTFYKEGKRVDARYAGQEALCFGLLCLKDGNRESFLSLMDHVIKENQIPIESSTEVWSIKQNAESRVFEVKASNGKTYRSDFVIIAIGKMSKPKQPEYYREIPASLKSNGSLLFDINTRSLNDLKVLVVGGGDSAAEYAHMLSEQSQVTLSYRQKSFSRLNAINLGIVENLIGSRKIKSYLPSNIVKIEDEGGRPLVHFAESEYGSELFDAVLFGLGGMSPLEFLRTAGVKSSERGEAVINEHCESSVPGIYVVGDLVGKGKGGGSIISGFNSGALAVKHILQHHLGRDPGPALVELGHLKF